MKLNTRLPWQTALLGGRCRPRLHSPITRRHASYKLPYLAHQEVYTAQGLDPVFSPDGFDSAWTQYQAYLLYNVNQMIEETPKDLLSVVLNHARSAEHADIFNFASMAHNNHFFFQGMNPKPPPMHPEMATHIEKSFSSVESLRTTFLATANAMFGPGFVWLVKNKANELGILTTYIAGSPYPGAHYRRQPVDMNNVTTHILPSTRPIEAHRHNEVIMSLVTDHAGYAGAFGQTSSRAVQLAPGGADVVPLLAVSTWEHTFMRDWGSWGKREFLEQWWEKIDWDVAYNKGVWRELRSMRMYED